MGHGAATLEASAAIAALVVATAISVAIIIAIRPWLKRIALAKPNARSSHGVPTPQGGGIAVIPATIIAAAGALYWFVPAASAPASVLALLVAVIIIAAVGAADDIRPIGVAPRFFLQAVSVALVIFALPDELRVAPFLPLLVERLLLTLGGLWFVNLVNFMDGLDWMTVAEVVPVTAALAIFGACGFLPALPTIISLALCGAMIGFAFFNRPVARLFLGDVGSLPIGLLLGWLLMQLAGRGALATAILLPLYYLAELDHHARAPPVRRRKGVASAPLAFLPARDRPRLYGEPGGGARLCGQYRARRACLCYACRARPSYRDGCARLRCGPGGLVVAGICARKGVTLRGVRLPIWPK